MVPRAILMKSGLVSINTARQNISKTAVSVNTARQVNTAHSKTTVNAARPISKSVMAGVLKKTDFLIRCAGKFKKNLVPRAVLMKSRLVSINTARQNTLKIAVSVNTARQPQMDSQDQGVIDSGCSRHMSWNMSYLSDYEETDG
ncbi:hypothetical protein Tco_0088082 [Tanacetum coccineum]